MARLARILIVGGGIAGLALASALHQRGLAAELAERSPVWDASGAGILLHANGVRILRELHMGRAIEQAGTVVSRWGWFDQQGTLLSETDLGAMWSAVGPCIGIERTKLLQALVVRAAAVPCRFGTAVTSLSQADEHVLVDFSDGSTGRYDLVVGADGISSPACRQAISTVRPSYAGLMVWRSIAPGRPRGLTTMKVLLGERCLFGLVPVGSDRTYGFGLVGEPRFHDPLAGRLERVRQRFAGFGSPVPEYLALLPSDAQLHCRPIEWVELDRWHMQRIVLIGDAAHAGPPTMAQGGSMALEDAYVLAEVLRSADTIDSALDAYAARRRPRVDWVERQSRAVVERLVQATAVRDAFFREQGDQMMHDNFGPLIPAP